MSQNRCFHLIPLFSSNSALFCAMERPQLLFHQSLPHSFPCNGGGGVSLAHPLPIRDSPHATVSPVLATHPKNRQLTPLFATHPIAGSCKSLNSHTYDTPRGVFDGRIAGQRRAALLVLGHQSPFTSHQSPPSVPLRWPSRSARIGIVRDDTCLWPLTWAKRWETKPLLPVSKNGSGQTGPASCSAPCPVKGFRRRRNRKSCLGTSFYSL
jgi:hypothetical protein